MSLPHPIIGSRDSVRVGSVVQAKASLVVSTTDAEVCLLQTVCPLSVPLSQAVQAYGGTAIFRPLRPKPLIVYTLID